MGHEVGIFSLKVDGIVQRPEAPVASAWFDATLELVDVTEYVWPEDVVELEADDHDGHTIAVGDAEPTEPTE